MREVTPAKLHFSKQNSCGIEYRNFTIKYFNFRNIRYIFKIKNGSFKIIQCNIKIKCLNLRNNFFNFWNNSGNFRSKYWIFSINYYNAKIKCCLQFLISKLKPTASKCEAMQIRIKFGNFKKKCSNIINLELKNQVLECQNSALKSFRIISAISEGSTAVKEFFFSVFFRMQENADQTNSEYGQFSHSKANEMKNYILKFQN